MKVLISAYACGPHQGSEPEVGLRIMLAVAAEHEVWVLTRRNNLDGLEAYLADHPLRSRIHLVGFDLGERALRFKKRLGLISLHWYHDSWQRGLARVARQLDDEIGFDVVHHATFATYWTRAGVAAVDKPLVWGPVGGGVRPPLRLIPVMGLKGAISDLARVALRPAVARLSGSMSVARSAGVILVQNPETGRLMPRGSEWAVLPNALVVAADPVVLDLAADVKPNPVSRSVVTSGRLIGWKGTLLAVMAMEYVQDRRLRLEIYGSGPQAGRLRSYAARRGLDDRVVFHGQVPRHRVLAATRQASALIHPALHDEASLAVAESLALGTPVVFLDLGGPKTVASYWSKGSSVGVVPTSPAVTARSLAKALEEVADRRMPIGGGQGRVFAEGVLGAYEKAAEQGP